MDCSWNLYLYLNIIYWIVLEIFILAYNNIYWIVLEIFILAYNNI